jgi:hypothetical protein
MNFATIDPSMLAYVDQCIELLNNNEARQAIKFVSPKFTVKVTRQLHRGKIDKQNRQVTYIVTCGEPCYIAAKIIKDLKAAGEPFPVKKIKIFPLKNGGNGVPVKRRIKRVRKGARTC